MPHINRNRTSVVARHYESKVPDIKYEYGLFKWAIVLNLMTVQYGYGLFKWAIVLNLLTLNMDMDYLNEQ